MRTPFPAGRPDSPRRSARGVGHHRPYRASPAPPAGAISRHPQRMVGSVLLLTLATAMLGLLTCDFQAVSAAALSPHSAGRIHVLASTERCHTNQLTVVPVASSGAAGHNGIMFRLHDRSHVACGLIGYPGAQLLNGQRKPLPTHVHRGQGYIAGSPKVHVVTLKPGGNAYFVMEWADIPTGNQNCSDATNIKITPPNAFTSAFIHLTPRYSIAACGGILNVTPVSGKKYSL